MPNRVFVLLGNFEWTQEIVGVFSDEQKLNEYRLANYTERDDGWMEYTGTSHNTGDSGEWFESFSVSIETVDNPDA